MQREKQPCPECEKMGKPKLVAKHDKARHMAMVHKIVFSRKVPADGKKCEGCFEMFSHKDIKEHERACS